MATKAGLRKHSHKHLLGTLARGVKHERDYVLKTAPPSLDSLLHIIAKDIVNGKLTIRIPKEVKKGLVLIGKT